MRMWTTMMKSLNSFIERAVVKYPEISKMGATITDLIDAEYMMKYKRGIKKKGVVQPRRKNLLMAMCSIIRFLETISPDVLYTSRKYLLWIGNGTNHSIEFISWLFRHFNIHIICIGSERIRTYNYPATDVSILHPGRGKSSRKKSYPDHFKQIWLSKKRISSWELLNTDLEKNIPLLVDYFNSITSRDVTFIRAKFNLASAKTLNSIFAQLKSPVWMYNDYADRPNDLTQSSDVEQMMNMANTHLW